VILMTEKPLIIQFSGGRTSAFMAKFLFEHFPEREKHVLFQNTGKEHEGTLEFILECDRRWDLRVVWLEAVVSHDQRKSSRHKVVDFESASRNGEPYEEVIKKYGLANMVYSHCTRELKIRVGESYIKNELGLKDYEIAIGIRSDEQHRINRLKAIEYKTIYPLVDIIQVNKKFIKNWWADQDFDLKVPHYLGNCDMCFKKSIKHLVSIVREQPERAEWWEAMQNKYALTGRTTLDERRIFRGHRTVQDLRDLVKEKPSLFDTPEMTEEFDCFCKSS